MKHILVVHYSQSGQLTEILDNVLRPIKEDDEVKVTSLRLEMDDEYPFPWTKETFLDVFPESVLQVPAKLKAIPEHIFQEKYDLIILGYQVWYLSPSIPINSFLELPEAKQMIENTPVVTVLGCRNMWVMAQEKIKKMLRVRGANLVGNIALVDRHLNHVSVITIVKWMFSGEKKKYLGVFPKPGVSQNDIDSSSKYGEVILKFLKKGAYNNLQSELLKIGAVKIKPFLVLADSRASIFFKKWAKFIRGKGEPKDKLRVPWLTLFKYYLLFAIWIIAPIVFILFLLAYIPMYSKIKRTKEYYSSIELK